MNGELAQRARKIFDQALEIPATGRSKFIESACSGDAQLQSSVSRLLAEFEQTSGTFQSHVKIEKRDQGFTTPPYFGKNHRFSVQRQIGAGAFGSVFEVWDSEEQVR